MKWAGGREEINYYFFFVQRPFAQFMSPTIFMNDLYNFLNPQAYLPTLETLNASFNLLTAMGKDFHGLPVLCAADLSHNNIASMTIDLVSNTRCSNHGVVGKLEIILQGKSLNFCSSKLLP